MGLSNEEDNKSTQCYRQTSNPQAHLDVGPLGLILLLIRICSCRTGDESRRAAADAVGRRFRNVHRIGVVLHNGTEHKVIHRGKGNEK